MSKKHLKFVDSLPCICCMRDHATHHHLMRVSEAFQPIAKYAGFALPVMGGRGMGKKNDDRFCLPVCELCHSEAHRIDEREFFALHGIESTEETALFFWKHSGNLEKCLNFIWELRGVYK